MRSGVMRTVNNKLNTTVFATSQILNNPAETLNRFLNIVEEFDGDKQKLTLAMAQAEARKVGGIIRKVNEEYQCKLVGWTWEDDKIYFTDDIEDAVDTIKAMAAHGKVDSNALTPEEIKEIHRAAEDTWDGIAGDILSAMDENEVTRDTVVEMVLDADRLFLNGYLDKAIYDKFKNLPVDEKIKIVKQAFKYEHYGY